MSLYLGPSGGGKGTIIDTLLARNPENSTRISTYTTRAKRPLEDDVGQYRYITQSEFDRLSAQGQILSPSSTDGKSYGCPKIDVNDERYRGKYIFIDMGPRGAKEFKSIYNNTVCVFVIPPTKERLLLQMKGRESRWKRNVDQIPLVKECCDWLVVNDTPDEAASQIEKIMQLVKQYAHNWNNADEASLRFLYDRNLHNKKNIEFLDSFYGKQTSFPEGPDIN